VNADAVPSALRDAVAARVLDDPTVIDDPSDRTALRAAVARALAAEGVVVAPARWARLVRDLVDELGGLGPIEPLLRDPAVTDVMVNAPHDVWVERAGTLERSEVAFADDDHVLRVLRRVLGPIGIRLDRAHPWADAVLADGVRLHAVLPPVAEHPIVTLRRVAAVVPAWDELARSGTVPPEAAEMLVAMVRERRNIVVCGRAGVGKTTLLARLLAEIGEDRAVIIEDAPELHAPSRHAIALRVLGASPDGGGGVDVAALVRNALRMRPDRLVVGEVRGHEVADLLQAMNTGHSGSMSTVHANGAADALVRLEGMALLAGVPVEAARSQLATAVDVVVALRRGTNGARRLAEIAEVRGGPDGIETKRLWS
jgi:pilus assembly protein CpaF